MDAPADIAHDWILKALNREKVDEAGAPTDALKMWTRFLEFINTYRPETLGASLVVRSETHNYVEAIDFYWLFDGSRTLGLVETQYFIPPDLSICLAGAAHADYVMDPEAPGGRRPMPEYDKLAVLHVRPDFARILEVGHVGILAEAYLSGRVFPDVHRVSRPDPEFVLPDTSSLARKYLM